MFTTCVIFAPSMTQWNYILRPIVALIALLIMAVHVAPSSILFFDSEICINLNPADSESEESKKEKEKEKELFEESGSSDQFASQKVLSFLEHSTSLPTPPFLETLSPPPDFV